MQIEAISAVFPSRVVTNDDVVEMIASHSKNFEGDLNRALRQIRMMLKGSGANTRRWLGRGETSLDLTVEACQKAMLRLSDPTKIDLVISASVYAELVEPSTANLVAHKIGLDNAECFDVKEACDGWMKAARLASFFIESNTYSRVMVVNSEFPLRPGFGVYPELFNLTSVGQLEHRFPGFTLGEAATVTIFAADGNNRWQFKNKTRNDLCDLCTITSRFEDLMPASSRIARDGLGVFTSYGAELRQRGFPIAVEMFKQEVKSSEVDLLFTHSSSKKDWSEGAAAVGLSEKLYDIYASHGNVVSAAIPAAMALAEEDGTLKRRQNIAAWVASAGMSFSTTQFLF